MISKCLCFLSPFLFILVVVAAFCLSILSYSRCPNASVSDMQEYRVIMNYLHQPLCQLQCELRVACLSETFHYLSKFGLAAGDRGSNLHLSASACMGTAWVSRTR